MDIGLQGHSADSLVVISSDDSTSEDGDCVISTSESSIGIAVKPKTRK